MNILFLHLMKYFFTTKFVVRSIWVIALCTVTISSLTYTSGGPAASTNAPGEGNCTGCHSGSLVTSGTAHNDFTLSGNFYANGYLPDSTYTITVKQRYTGRSKFGFQMTCLDGNNRMAGSIAAVNNRTQRNTANVQGGQRQYINHSGNGTSGTDSITWQFEWTAPSSNLGKVTFYGVTNASNSNVNPSGDIIISKSFDIQPSDSIPRATASANATTVCVGKAVSLRGSSTANPTSWRWAISGGSPSVINTQNGNVTFSTAGTYYASLQTTNSFGSSTLDSVRIVVTAAPFVEIFENPVNEICPGDSFQLTANFTVGATYLWSNNATGNTIWVKDSGDYTVTMSLNGCASESNAVKIRYKNKPVPSLWSDAMAFGDSSCSSNFLTLIASPSGEKNYLFLGNDTSILQNSTNDTLKTLFISDTKYSVLVESNDGCWSDTVSFIVFRKDQLAAPTINCDVNSTSSVSFSWTGVGHQGFQMSLDSGNTWFNYNNSNYTINNTTPSKKHQVMVRQFDAPPCDFSEVAVKECSSRDCEIVNFVASFDSAICFNSSTLIQLSGLDNHPGYLVSFNGIETRNTSFEVSPSFETVYRIGVRDTLQAGCPENIKEVLIKVDRIGSNFINLDKPSGVYCQGESITISANDTLEFFEFYANSSLLYLGNDYKHISSNIKNGDSLWVVVTTGACSDTSDKIVVRFVDLPNSNFSYDREGSIYTFTPENLNYNNYLWDFGNGNSSASMVATEDFKNQSNQSINVSLNVVDGFECTSEKSENIVLPNFANIEGLSSGSVKIYPNPAKEVLHIEANGITIASFEVYDITGKLVLKSTESRLWNSIDISSLNTGNYLLLLQNGQENSKILFTKE
jgi:PKD repeat protein